MGHDLCVLSMSHGLLMISGMPKYVKIEFLVVIYSVIHIFSKSKLPDGGKPLCFVIYADKTNLSSFGTVKGYPVIARCANLPADIRNGEGVAGGRVVGWLPVVRLFCNFFTN
jgi:hypothetical protein